MKSKEIVEYYVYDYLRTSKPYITQSYEEALSYYDEGCMITETHTMLWDISPFSQAKTIITSDWTSSGDEGESDDNKYAGI
ncbi:MAG: hypothetical protein LBT89_11925 [Planctomycetaceae bacterium]|jgi:hypothetical protein|nr:hypothetical protein [Planctomycetaceae bacterium]